MMIKNIDFFHQVHGQPAKWGDRTGVPGVFARHEYHLGGGLCQDLAALHQPGPGADGGLHQACPVTHPAGKGKGSLESHTISFLSASSASQTTVILHVLYLAVTLTEKKKQNNQMRVVLGFWLVLKGRSGVNTYWTLTPWVC